MKVHGIKEKKPVWELDSIIMQTSSHHLRLFCEPTWPSYHLIENHLCQYLNSLAEEKGDTSWGLYQRIVLNLKSEYVSWRAQLCGFKNKTT